MTFNAMNILNNEKSNKEVIYMHIKFGNEFNKL